MASGTAYCNKIHCYSKHSKKKRRGGELAKVMVFWDLTPYNLVYTDCFCEVPVILHNDLHCKTHQLVKQVQDTPDQMRKSSSGCNDSASVNSPSVSRWCNLTVWYSYWSHAYSS